MPAQRTHPFAEAAAALLGILKTYGKDRLELEFRLGHRVGGGTFVPGVVDTNWTTLKQLLDEALAAGPDFEYVEITETVESSCSIAGGKYVVHQEAPQRHDRGQAAPRALPLPPPAWVHKKRLATWDAPVPGAPWCCRLSASLEETQAAPPPTARPSFTRHKKRWSYVHRCWSIDVTRVVSNLPHQLDNDDVSLELEFELRDQNEFLTRPVEDVLEWGWTLVTRACEAM